MKTLVQWAIAAPLILHMLASFVSADSPARCIMYLTGQHNLTPSDPDLSQAVTHVILAFMRSDVFNSVEMSPEFPLFTNVGAVRNKFSPETKVLVAIGGWGDSHGFEKASQGVTSRKQWCHNVKRMIDITGADGIDVDWEYPGGNRDDYKMIPNEKRAWEIEAFVQLLTDLRTTIGYNKSLSIAVPGLERDMMAFTDETLPRIVRQVDFINVMTYDLLNRRDTIVKHHSGVSGSLDSIKSYMERGAPSSMLNLGLAYYVKWVLTEDCNADNPIGCPTQQLEDPDSGADLGKIAAFSWHDKVPSGLEKSFARAKTNGRYFDDGSFGYWDREETRWWTFDTEDVIKQKLHEIVRPMRLGGVFAWGIGEDAPEFTHLSATIGGMRDLQNDGSGNASQRDKDEL